MVTEPICLYSKSSCLFFFQQVIQDFYQQFVGGAHGGLTGNADVLRVLNVVKTEAAFDLEQFGFLPNENVDFDSFLTDEENPQKKPKTITCPHCGKTFEK